MKVAVFVGTRADLGPLVPVIHALAHRDGVDPVIVTGVAFDTAELTTRLQRELGHLTFTTAALAPPLASVDRAAQLAHGPLILEGVQELLASGAIDRLVVLGDRWELLYVVPAFFLAEVPIVHLHGGEVTEGAIDERVRHAVTKLADVHCVASADARDRLVQMGESSDRIHLTGAPGLDRYAQQKPWSDDRIAEALGVPIHRPLAMFTYHPPTAAASDQIGRWAAEALEATAAAAGTVIATHPGMDPGRDEILEALQFATKQYDNVVVIEALGGNYPGVLTSSDVVVGNSSSGVIEAASAGIPAVDIGERQRGRLRGHNVVWADEGGDAVRTALATALSPEFRANAKTVVNPYGAGNAAGAIVDAVVAPTPPRTKRFVDLPN